ncbi:MAG: acetoacetyl-CoA synthetase [Actinomycetota bacterium]|jgi:acetoacetyl-CoA synthetase|nr:acetoacetyl-CoA synthetase [Actinomycetota bacterium]
MTDDDVLYRPSAGAVAATNLARYMATVGFDSYDDLWLWSVDELESFWASIWDFFDVPGTRGDTVLADRTMPGARWFPGAELNYAEQALRWDDDRPAVEFRTEPGGRPPETISHRQLRRRVAEVAAGLRGLGVGRGDRVAAYAPNIPETLVAFLATASLGAIWSSCSPDFGVTAVLDRFRQIEPKVLVAADGYRYRGRVYDRRPEVAELARNLPSVVAVVTIANVGLPVEGLAFDDLVVAGAGADLVVERVPFEHPLWILYSSGTTGLPKALVHGHGGIVLEHLKALSLHHDLGRDDRFFWFSSTGWMMWNLLVGGLLVGATVVLYDGSPVAPDLGALWRMAEDTGTTYFGVSAAYLQSCLKAGIVPREVADLSRLRGLGSTGAPLTPEGFRWAYENVKRRMMLGSVSGGTDVCTAFVGSCPVLPVVAGEIQCSYLGAAVEAFDEDGKGVVDEVGELVVTEPMPSMPVFLWGDHDHARYRAAYFDTYPGVWRHGDWIRFTNRGSCVIYGRSDSTLNRGGVRIGTSELYRVVEELDPVVDSLVVDTGRLGHDGRCWLFVVLADGAVLDDDLRATIVRRLRAELSPRHVPDEIVAVAEVPRTLNGKKLEVPVKRILLGEPWPTVVSPDGMANPAALEYFVHLAERDGP